MKLYKRYMVFRFSDYYPGGGLGDCRYDTDFLDEAVQWAINAEFGDYRYVFDRVEGIIVWDRDGEFK